MRRVVIEIKVEEKGAVGYSWDTVATTEFTASAELFDEETAANAVNAAVKSLLRAQLRAQRPTAVPAVADRELPEAFDELGVAIP